MRKEDRGSAILLGDASEFIQKHLTLVVFPFLCLLSSQSEVLLCYFNFQRVTNEINVALS